MKLNESEFYGDDYVKPLHLEKMYIDDKRDVKFRNMTYEYDGFGFIPAFEINDCIIDINGGNTIYKIERVEREFDEWYVRDSSGLSRYLGSLEMKHILKGVEWI